MIVKEVFCDLLFLHDKLVNDCNSLIYNLRNIYMQWMVGKRLNKISTIGGLLKRFAGLFSLTSLGVWFRLFCYLFEAP